jgi:hypothetical protein
VKLNEFKSKLALFDKALEKMHGEMAPKNEL